MLAPYPLSRSFVLNFGGHRELCSAVKPLVGETNDEDKKRGDHVQTKKFIRAEVSQAPSVVPVPCP
jgi:hypothetical protein